MLPPAMAQQVLETIELLDRRQLVEHIARCRARLPVDFTREWLEKQPTKDLRHVYAAMCLQWDMIPRLEQPPGSNGRAA